MSRSLECSSSGSHLRKMMTCALLLLGILPLPLRAASADCAGILPDLDPSCERSARPAGGIAPMSMPYLFEDPYITTGLQLATLWHKFPGDSVFQGGQATVIALQARVAITDRLAFIATKDGLTFFRPDTELGGSRVLKDTEDLMDITAGFKFALIDLRSEKERLIFTPSLRYEVPLGAHRLFQGKGDGVLIPGGSVGWTRGDFHAIGDVGAQVPFDGDRDSTSVFYNLHLDYSIEIGGGWVVPFIELNGMHWTSSGDGGAVIETKLGPLTLQQAQDALGTGPFEGADIANLGSANIAGADLNTMAWGLRVLLDSRISVGASYERAISKRKDIFDQRVSVMATYEF